MPIDVAFAIFNIVLFLATAGLVIYQTVLLRRIANNTKK